tara:strand:+ start:162 stop:629 length:468 start_codon:yes stop_codon:yes gene_type:complete
MYVLFCASTKRDHGPEGVAAYETYAPFSGLIGVPVYGPAAAAFASTASGGGVWCAGTSLALKHGDQTDAFRIASPTCQIWCASAAGGSPFPPRELVSAKATVLCDHGGSDGSQIEPSHSSSAHSNGPVAFAAVKWAEDESVVHEERLLWPHMNDA